MSNTLFTFQIELPKQNAAFLYFILESLEGLVFYSTLEHVVGAPTRLIHITGTRENFADFAPILKELQEILSMEVLSSSL